MLILSQNQTVMDHQQHYGLAHAPEWTPSSTTNSAKSLWADSLMIPAYFALLSSVTLVGHLALSRLFKNRGAVQDEGGMNGVHSPVMKPEGHARSPRLAFGLARLIGCLCLVTLTVISSISDGKNGEDVWTPTAGIQTTVSLLQMFSEVNWSKIGMSSTLASEIYILICGVF